MLLDHMHNYNCQNMYTNMHAQGKRASQVFDDTRLLRNRQ